jgi:hypothetical protein
MKIVIIASIANDGGKKRKKYEKNHMIGAT